MKILVFDDNELHRNAAVAQLQGHEVTVVVTYQQAEGLLVPRFDMDLYYAAADKRMSPEEAQKAAIVAPQQFDVVLTDLLVPAPTQRLTEHAAKKFNGYDMPLGVFIALLGATRAGVKYVAVLTDANHHSHPASACFDEFNLDRSKGPEDQAPIPFAVNGAKMVLCNTGRWMMSCDPSDLTKESSGPGRVIVKNWRALLEYLVG